MNACELSAKAMRKVMSEGAIVMIDRALKLADEAAGNGRRRIIFTIEGYESFYEERFSEYLKVQGFRVYRGDGIHSFPVVARNQLIIQW